MTILPAVAACAAVLAALPRATPPTAAGGSRTTFFPVAPPPAKVLTVVDISQAEPDTKLLLMSLQGLVNRKQPRLYLIHDSKWIGRPVHVPAERRRDEFWLAWMQERRYVRGVERVPCDTQGVAGILARYRSDFSGAVVPDPNLPVSNVVAITVAGAENLVVCTPRLAENYAIPVRVDLRGKFVQNHEAMEWVWRTFRGVLSHGLVASAVPLAHAVLSWSVPVDYYVQNRAFVFWVTGKESIGKPGCDAAKEQAVVEGVLSELPANIPVCGVTWAGLDEGLGEWAGVKMVSDWGDVLMPACIPNLSVHSGVRVSRLPTRRHPAAPALDHRKVYAALTSSDGDALATYYNFYVDWFRSADHGRLPMGLGIGPTAIDLIPALVEWYYAHAAPRDEFFCDVSGIGYMYPERFAYRRGDRDAVVQGFMDWTGQYMARMGLEGLRPYGGGRRWMERCSRQIKGLRYLIPGYGVRAGQPPRPYRVGAGVPVLPAATPIVADDMRAAFLDAMGHGAGPQRPAFVNAFVNVTVHDWTFLYDIPDVAKAAGTEVIFVTPGELAQLYQQSR